jgi:hypothetical protein
VSCLPWVLCVHEGTNTKWQGLVCTVLRARTAVHVFTVPAAAPALGTV